MSDLHGFVSFPDEIVAYVTLMMETEAEVIETACEMAIQDGRFGVLVTSKIIDGKWTCEAGPHPSVPYGQITHDR